MKKASTILATAFPIAPTCLSLVGMDESDLAQLRQRIAVVRRVRRSLEGDLRMISDDNGASALWFMQKASLPTNTGGLDVQQADRSMYLHFPPQDGVRKFRIEAEVAMPRQKADEPGAQTVIDMILDVYDAVLDLPHGGLDGTPDEVAAAAARATSIVSALHAAEGREAPGACVYVPRTPWRDASIVRHRSDGGGAFLRKPASATLLADDPVCISMTRTDDGYGIRGIPNRHVLNGRLPDAVEALRTLASIAPMVSPSEALVQRKGSKS